jgi:hypothetical protein
MSCRRVLSSTPLLVRGWETGGDSINNEGNIETNRTVGPDCHILSRINFTSVTRPSRLLMDPTEVCASQACVWLKRCEGFATVLEFAAEGNFEGNFDAVNVNSCCVCLYIEGEQRGGRGGVLCNIICMIPPSEDGLLYAACRLLPVSIQASEVAVRVS